MENKPNRVIWHHSADVSPGPQAAKINTYHHARKFPISKLGFWGGYHYLIEKSGLVVQYRNENEIGAHDANENINSLGVCLAGNFNLERPTAAQEVSLASLLSEIVARYKIPLARIEPHRYGDTTDCPGRLLSDHWAARLYAQYQLSWLQRQLLALMNLIIKL